MTPSKLRLKVNFWILLLLFISSTNVHSQALKEESKLFDKPNGSPQGLAISGKTSVKVLERQGFWVRVDVGGRVGWLKASGLNFSSTPSGPTAIDTGRLGTGNIVSTSAARGLSAKDILAGVPKVEEVQKMQKYVSTEAELKLFVVQGKIVASKQVVEVQSLVVPTSLPAGEEKSSQPQPTKSGTKRASDDW